MQVQAQVTRTAKQGVYVKVDRSEGGCGRCQEPGGCRSGLLGQLFGFACQEYLVADSVNLSVGTRILLEVPDSAPMKAAALAYVLPLLSIFVCTTALFYATGSEVFAALGALGGGLGALLLLVKLKQMGLLDNMRPRVVKRLDC